MLNHFYEATSASDQMNGDLHGNVVAVPPATALQPIHEQQVKHERVHPFPKDHEKALQELRNFRLGYPGDDKQAFIRRPDQLEAVIYTHLTHIPSTDGIIKAGNLPGNIPAILYKPSGPARSPNAAVFYSVSSVQKGAGTPLLFDVCKKYQDDGLLTLTATPSVGFTEWIAKEHPKLDLADLPDDQVIELALERILNNQTAVFVHARNGAVIANITPPRTNRNPLPHPLLDYTGFNMLYGDPVTLEENRKANKEGILFVAPDLYARLSVEQRKSVEQVSEEILAPHSSLEWHP